MEDKKENTKPERVELHKVKGPALPSATVYKRGDVLAWGERNCYPDIMRKYYDDSSIHQSILNTKANYIGGTGLYTDNKDEKLNAFIKRCNHHGDTLQDIYDKISFDFLVHNGFALQVQWTRATGRIAGIFYVPFSKLRYTSDKKRLVHCDDWSGIRALRKEYHELYDESSPVGTQIYYYTGKRTVGPYPEPSYSGALADIYASTEISKFHARKISGGLFADLFIEIMGAIPSEEEKEKIESKFTKKFASTDSTNTIIFGYAANADESTKINALPNADPQGQRFIDLRKSVSESIITAHQITSPILLAVPKDGLSFGSEFQDAFKIFNITYVQPTVEEILKPINRLLSVNFEDPGIKIAPLPAITTQLDDQTIITSNMTTLEIRRYLKRAGYIESEQYQEGTLTKETSPQGAGVEQAINGMIKKQTDALKPKTNQPKNETDGIGS